MVIYVRPPRIVLCRLFCMERKNIFPMMVDMVGSNRAEQKILVGDRWEFPVGF